MNQQKITIAVSSCLVGDQVRYDGKSKTSAAVISLISEYFDVIRICPEVGIGMGVPRPAIQLVEKRGGCVHASGVEDKSQDVTDKLVAYLDTVTDQLKNISGYIFKARSPSCGVGSTPVFSEIGDVKYYANGVFAQTIINAYPDLPIADESVIENKKQCAEFLDKVRAYHTRCFTHDA